MDAWTFLWSVRCRGSAAARDGAGSWIYPGDLDLSVPLVIWHYGCSDVTRLTASYNKSTCIAQTSSLLLQSSAGHG